MQREELTALGQLAGDVVAGLTAQIQGVNAGIAQRVFSAIGPGAAMAGRVTTPSPAGPVDHHRHVGGANHFDLLDHPAIYEQIKRWLSTGRPQLRSGER